jgi:outer membrane protein
MTSAIYNSYDGGNRHVSNSSFMKEYLICTVLAMILAGHRAIAQPAVLSLKDALSLTQNNLPRLKAFKEQANAAAENIALSKNTLMPELTAAYQADYATFNNITGMSYPGYMMPITGPPSASNNINFVAGSALTAFADWNPLTFGQRNAAIEKASAQFRLANAGYSQELFRQQYAAMYTYLDAIYQHQLLVSLRANARRIETALDQSTGLAREGLKPGIDTVQFQSALAKAQADYLSLQRAYETQLIELTRLTGLPQSSDGIILSDTLITQRLPLLADTSGVVDDNPVLQYYRSRQQLSKASLKEIQTAWRPRLDVWGNAYARGSGVSADGYINKSDGFNLTRTNYGLGLQLSFPILHFAQVDIRKRQYRALLNADEDMISQTALDLRKQWQTAMMIYRQNIKIAQQTKIQERLATLAYEGLMVSYKSGLIDYTRLSQGEYDLLNAEAGDAGAYLQVWRSILDIAVARGDLNMVLEQMQ